MLKRLILCTSATLMLVLPSLPVSQAQSVPNRDSLIPISTYRDDPFVAVSVIGHIDRRRFKQAENRPALYSNQVEILDEAVIYREDRQTGEFKPFAWNPWPETRPNENGDFSFPNEERFPLFRPERGPDGKIILYEGLQVWTPNNLNLGATTAFEASHAVKDAAEAWAGRNIKWGKQTGEYEGELQINSHSFIDFNGFYAPGARQVFLGVVPYRLPGETVVKMFEVATSWEMVGHECGHAVHHAIKPNIDLSDQKFRTWSESFADQAAMWASLQNRERVSNLLTETNGNFHQSNSLSRLAEAFAALINEGTSMRDCFHDKRVSDTTEEIHDRSEVLTGAAYKIFLTVYDELKRGNKAEEALQKAGQIMGVFLMRSTDYTPENEMTLEDVAKAYLKVDKEFFGSRYHSALVNEFVRREIFDANSEHEWLVHENSLPYLYLYPYSSDQDIEEFLQANVNLLGLGQDFGLKLQNVTREGRFGQMVVRAQLTLGRDEYATPLNNHGILVFRADGLLCDYHPPLQSYLPLQGRMLSRAQENVQIRNLISQAKRLRLDRHGAPLSIVRKPDGQLTVESHVLRGTGLNTYLEVFTPNNPRGERREVMIPPVPPNKRISIPSDILN